MKTVITIKRPEGNVETLDVSDKFTSGLTDGMFATIKAATLAAGRGECLSYTVAQEAPTADLLAESIEDAKKHDWFVRQGFNSNNVNY